jgi:hypothetical protein
MTPALLNVKIFLRITEILSSLFWYHIPVTIILIYNLYNIRIDENPSTTLIHNNAT